MNRTWALYKKELRSFFVSPLFYVVTAVFLCLCGLFFYSDLNFFTQFGFIAESTSAVVMLPHEEG